MGIRGAGGKDIVAKACNIFLGQPQQLYWGDISGQQSWGQAPEYVEAMYQMLQQERLDNIVIATPETSKGEDFVAEVWASTYFDGREHVITDTSLLIPTDIAISRRNRTEARQQLGWQAHYKM